MANLVDMESNLLNKPAVFTQSGSRPRARVPEKYVIGLNDPERQYASATASLVGLEDRRSISIQEMLGYPKLTRNRCRLAHEIWLGKANDSKRSLRSVGDTLGDKLNDRKVLCLFGCNAY